MMDGVFIRGSYVPCVMPFLDDLDRPGWMPFIAYPEEHDQHEGGTGDTGE
jgi:hypothetical protein